METIIRDHILNHLQKFKLINVQQHGFLHRRSCLTNLLETLEDWTRALDEGYGVDSLYLDYQKAFDSVPHRRLLCKLRGYGIDGVTINWIRDFLVGREMQVCVGDGYSDTVEVSSGVPQGSVLGPLLFLIYANDFGSDISCSYKLFADDSKVYSVIRTHEDAAKLQSDLEKISDWSKKWLLSFNVEKCKIMHIGRNNPRFNYSMMNSSGDRVILTETTAEKDLGVWIPENLKSELQCAKSAEKGMRALRLIKRTFSNLDEAGFNILYRTYIRPHLEYAVQAWSPHLRKDIITLENIQKRATRLVWKIKHLPYEDRLKRLGLMPLETRRIRGDLIETFKILKEYDQVSNVFVRSHTTHLRGNSMKLYKGQCRTVARSKFFSQRVIDLWNKLPDRVVTSKSIDMFKQRLDSHMTRSGHWAPTSY